MCTIPGHAGGQGYDPPPQPPVPIVVTYELYVTRSPQVHSDCRVKVHLICRTTLMIITGIYNYVIHLAHLERCGLRYIKV